jgi:phosphoadenosine phosphosulfate reductase
MRALNNKVDTTSTPDVDLDTVNRDLGRQPEALTKWALDLDESAIVTTKFGPFSAVLLHMVTRFRPDIPVAWVDTGYGTAATYRFADELTKLLNLKRMCYRPIRSRLHREAVDGPTPAVDDPRHAEFTYEVKLEPFEHALRDLKPKVWLTGLRAQDTELRAQMQPVSVNKDGLIKVAPVLYWTSKQLHEYLKQHGLPNNFDYFDPTKGEANRECGLHVQY